MRMRRKRNGAQRLLNCSDYMLSEPPYNKGENEKLMIEIGCGKGAFMLALAAREPDTTFVAIEKVPDVILLAAEKIKASELPNVKLLNADAGTLSEWFSAGSVDRIYLNFSDPWPRPKHAKRRLTAPAYLELYKKLLSPDGAIFLKTDNRILFDYSLETFAEAGFRLEKLTYDLHNSEYEEGNIHTEYEDNFSAKGFTINRVEAYVK
ncbi:MAG: tRNA (guanosine(46)-N7)-methyltransferase TrmB [Clostridia bacterium]|nr:tRNA (guanosine(46)-N7)-methyltransferase TrmB [Clostridia bacterium]